MTPKRERVWVGLFVIAAVVVFSLTAVAVWGGMGRSGVSHRTYFKFSGGIQPGTAVRYGGMRVGTIQKVQIDPGDSSRIAVDLVVDSGTPLKTDSIARLSSLGPLSDSYVEISPGTTAAPLIAPGGVLPSVESLGFAQLGDTIQPMVPQIHEALDQLTQNLAGLQTTVARVNDLLNDNNRSQVGQALTRANDLLNDGNRSNVAASLNNLNELLNDARPKVAAGLNSINDSAAHLTPLLEEVKKTSDRADQVLSNVDSMLTENRPDMRISVTELKQALANSTAAIDQLQGIMNQNTVAIDEILENIRLSSSNIRTLTETVKRSPSSLIRGVKAEDRKPGGPQQ